MATAPIIVEKTSVEILMDKINTANPTNAVLLASDFTFSPPEPFTNPARPFVNTKVTLTARQESSYMGTRSIYYHRMDLADILSNTNVSIALDNSTVLSEIIPRINHFFGINLREDDYEEATIQGYNPAFPDQQVTVLVQAKESSYLFMGSYSLNLGPRRQEVNDEGFVKTYYTLVNDIANVPGRTSNIFALNSAGVLHEDFTFLRNASDITQCDVRRMYPAKNGNLFLDGNFVFTATIGNEASQIYAVRSVTLDTAGAIIMVDGDPPFGGDQAALVAQSPDATVKYVVDAGTTLGSQPNRLYRYLETEDGLMDTGYSASGVGYIPDAVAISWDGKLYTASEILTAPIPTNNNVVGKLVRIDRTLVNGMVDTTFEPIYITAPGNTDPLRVLQIIPVHGDGFWVLLNPLHGVSTVEDMPTINGLPTIVDPGLFEHAFNPIYRFNEAGQWRQTFSNDLKNNLANSIFGQPSPVLAPGEALLANTNTTVTLFTMRVNPITGYTHRMPITFKEDGALKNLSGDAYSLQYRWIDAREIVAMRNGSFLACGAARLRNMGGGWTSTAVEIVGQYKADGQVDRVLYRHAAPMDSPLETVAQVVVTEVAVG